MPSNNIADKSFQNNVSTRLVLIAAIGFLVLPGLHAFINSPVEAQSSPANLYIEPGTVAIRAPGSGGAIRDGKVVIDLKNGDLWGFPTNLAGSPCPIDPISGKPPIYEPVYLGRFNFSEMKTP